MNYKMMGRFLAQTLSVEAVFMIPALLISVFGAEAAAVEGFLITIGLLVLACAALYLLCKGAPNAFGAKEGLVCVSISWIVMSLLGCLPFVFPARSPGT